MADKIRMTKPQHMAVAVANVDPDQVAAWEAKGWAVDKPKRSKRAADKTEPKTD